jgi:hypothetical protein
VVLALLANTLLRYWQLIVVDTSQKSCQFRELTNGVPLSMTSQGVAAVRLCKQLKLASENFVIAPFSGDRIWMLVDENCSAPSWVNRQWLYSVFEYFYWIFRLFAVRFIMNSGAETFQVTLSRSAGEPWGFRLQGGADFATPLSIQSVSSILMSRDLFIFFLNTFEWASWHFDTS